MTFLIIILLAVAAVVSFVIANKQTPKSQITEIELAPESTPAPTVVAAIAEKEEAKVKAKKTAAKKSTAKKPAKSVK
jgi:hypothetical protein